LSLVHAQDAATAAVTLLVASNAEGFYYLDDGGGVPGPLDPNRRWPWGYQWDEVRGVLSTMFSSRIRNICIPISVLRLAALVAPPRLRNASAILHPDRCGDWVVDGWVCSAARLQGETGWRPKWDLVRGLRDTLFFYRRQGWL
jgi:nucleoside-diphosphate-sugar epimerase